MKESSEVTVMRAPAVPKIERQKTIEKEHREALERAVSLNIPHAITAMREAESMEDIDIEIESCEDDDDEKEEEEEEEASKATMSDQTRAESSLGTRDIWNDLVEKLFKKNESGQNVLNRDAIPP